MVGRHPKNPSKKVFGTNSKLPSDRMGKNVKNSDNSTRRGTEPRQQLEPDVVMMIFCETTSEEQELGLRKSNSK